jgi:hypothetical protein
VGGIRRHPLRGAFWGLLLGLGIGLYLTFVFPVIGLDGLGSSMTKLAIVALAVAVLGVVWGLAAPPKGVRPPAADEPPPPAPAPPSYDDAPPPPPPPDEEPPPAPPA